LNLLTLETRPSRAQQPQIPTLQVCNTTHAQGEGVVQINKRADGTHAGQFKITISLTCEPPGYPSGLLNLQISMNDSTIQGPVNASSFDQMTSTGRATPTMYLNGRCTAQEPEVQGCRYWLFVTDNGTLNENNPDIVGFLIMDGNGKRMAYGTGPLITGDLVVAPTVN